jgi:hypothetical protein
VDGAGYFEVRLEGLEGAYVVRMYYGYINSSHWVAKFVGGAAVAYTNFTTAIAQNQTYLLTLQHRLVDLGNGVYTSRLILGGFGQDIVLEDATATSIDVYQLKYVANQQILGVDYYAYTGEAVENLAHDPTPPSLPVVSTQQQYLGLGGLASKVENLTLAWVSSDPQSAITQYQYAVGTTPGASNKVPWTTVNPIPNVEFQTVTTSFTAQDGVTYYASVKAKNDKNMWSAVGTAPGVLADRYSSSGFFDPFDVSPLANTIIPYEHSSFGITHLAAEAQVHVENVNVATPAYLGNNNGDTTSTSGSFRIGMNFHDAPGGNTNAHMFELYLGSFLPDPANPGATYYKIWLLQNILTVEKYYQGTREVYRTYTATITKNSWGYLQFTFKAGKFNIQGLGINQTYTFSTTHPIAVNDFILRFQRVNMEVDNAALTDQTFGII